MKLRKIAFALSALATMSVTSCSKCSRSEDAAPVASTGGSSEWAVGACVEDEQTTLFKIKEVKGDQYNVAQLIKQTGAEAGTMDVSQERFSAKNGFKEAKCPGAP